MTKISQLPSDIAPTLTDYIPTVDIETGVTKRVTLAALLALMFANFDWSLNMKSALSTSSGTYGNGNNNMAGIGATISFTVAAACNAYVTCSVTMGTAGDTEFYPHIYLDGTLYKAYSPQATAGNANGRAFERSFAWVVPLTAGAHTISAGAYFVNGTGSYVVTTGGAGIAAVILGKVTA